MKYQELEKKVTPGPYRYDDALPGIVSDGCELSEDGGPLTVVNSLGSCSGQDPSADLTLLVHCHNHFGELLKVLKVVAECNWGCRQCQRLARDTLAKAENMDQK